MDDLLDELGSRLPELEWKINRLYPQLSSYNIPRGLFHPAMEYTGTACSEEIKANIQALSVQKNERSAHFLAERIKQKINVLVTLCQIDSKKKKPEEKVSFGIKMLSTRQQWIETLEKDINTLEKQQQALEKTLQHMKTGSNDTSILSVQKELGEVDRRVTLAKEALNQAIAKAF